MQSPIHIAISSISIRISAGMKLNLILLAILSQSVTICLVSSNLCFSWQESLFLLGRALFCHRRGRGKGRPEIGCYTGVI